MEMVRSMMAQANFPISFWGDALLTAAHILNLVPSKSVKKTPYELWTGRVANYSHLKPWGCAAFITKCQRDYGKLSAPREVYTQRV